LLRLAIDLFNGVDWVGEKNGRDRIMAERRVVAREALVKAWRRIVMMLATLEVITRHRVGRHLSG
jgi:RecB family exonuclease